jgi:hypothetical protein
MSEKLNFKKTKEGLDKLMDQAKESVAVLEALQKEGLSKAMSFLNSKNFDRAQTIANEKILETLKKMGLATREEVRELEEKVEELAVELRDQMDKLSKVSPSNSGKHHTKKTSKNDKDDDVSVID